MTKIYNFLNELNYLKPHKSRRVGGIANGLWEKGNRQIILDRVHIVCVCLLIALYFKLHYTLNDEVSNGLATILTSRDISHLVHFITNFKPDGRIHLPKLCLNH